LNLDDANISADAKEQINGLVKTVTNDGSLSTQLAQVETAAATEA
jgi:hypothetical protein